METPWRKEKKSKKILRKILSLILNLFVGGVFGFYIGSHFGKYLKLVPDKKWIPIFLFLTLLLFFVTFLLTVIIHETGHLVMGLLTGYEFVFYRIFRLLFIKDNGKIKIRWHKNGAVAGQCCLYPQKMSDVQKKKYPFFWYHAGGVLFNLITSVSSIFLMILIRSENIFFNLFFGSLAGWGVLTFLQNAYPYSKKYTNDGSNIRRMKNSVAARNFFYDQIRRASAFSNGKQIKDIPIEELQPKEEYFYDDDFIRSMEYAMYGDYLSANGNYSEALKQYEMVIPYFFQVPKEIRNLLLIQYLFLLIVNDAPIEIVKELYESDNIQSMKKKIRHISNVSVTLYAYQTLILKDEVKAEKTRKVHANFEGKTLYPFLYEMELHDMDYVLKKFREKKEE